VSLSQDGELASEVVVFLNRLSDYLFVAARFACLRSGGAEEVYKKGRGVVAGGGGGDGSGGSAAADA
jgi:cob(I)alamin adenosyltransferase